jgi:cobalamin-dependent methionine synthase I
LFDDATALLKTVVAKKWLKASGVYGFWPANSVGDDIVVYTDETRKAELTRFHTLRQQWERKGSSEFFALADFLCCLATGRRRPAQTSVAGRRFTKRMEEPTMATSFEQTGPRFYRVTIAAWWKLVSRHRRLIVSFFCRRWHSAP